MLTRSLAALHERWVGFRRASSPDERPETGATAVEYGLIIALIAVVIVAAVMVFGASVRDSFNRSASTISGVI